MAIKYINMLYKGLPVSIPAAILIWLGLLDGTEPTALVLWGIVFIVGLPCEYSTG